MTGTFLDLKSELGFHSSFFIRDRVLTHFMTFDTSNSEAQKLSEAHNNIHYSYSFTIVKREHNNKHRNRNKETTTTMAASNDYNNQLVPHYGPNYNPYHNNYYQQQPQEQPPPQQQQHPYYSYSPDAVPHNGIPSVITTDDDPDVGRSSNEDDDDDIPDDIVASQARAWRDAQVRNQQQPSTSLTTTFQPTRPNVPNSRNPNGSDGVHPNKAGMKTERQITTAAAAAGGAVVGAIVTGPIFPVGMVVGGAISGYTANKMHKQGERRAQRKWEQSNFQRGVWKAPIFQNKEQESYKIV
jgi:hypothetical protein